MTNPATTTTTNPTTEPQKQARHPMTALIAGMFCPGLGLVATGRITAGALAVALWLMVYLVLPVLVIDHAPDSLPTLPSLMLAANASVWFGAAILAAGLAWKDGPRVRRSYEHIWWLVGWFVLVFVGFSQLRSKVLETQLKMAPIWDTSLRPAIVEGQLLIVQRRGFDPRLLKVNDVIAVASAGKVINADGEAYDGYARVIAIEGSVVEVKEDGAVIVDGFPIINMPCPASVPHDGHTCVQEKQATPRGAVERYTTATSFARSFPPTSVGPGQVFVLPDDRGRQLTAPNGLIDVHSLLGTVIVAAR